MLVLFKSLLWGFRQCILDQGHIKTIVAGSPPFWPGVGRADIASVENFDSGVVEHMPTLCSRRWNRNLEIVNEMPFAFGVMSFTMNSR